MRVKLGGNEFTVKEVPQLKDHGSCEVTVTRTSRFVSVPADEPSQKVQSFLSKFIAWPLRVRPASQPRVEAKCPANAKQPERVHA